MKLVRLTVRGRDLHVLLVENEQRAVEIGARWMVDPRIGVPVGSSIGRIRRIRKVSCQLNQALLETDVPIELGIEIGGIEERSQLLCQGLARWRCTLSASYQGNGRQLD